MPFKINHFPSKQKPDPVRETYEPLVYYSPVYYGSTSRYQHVKTLRTKINVHPNKFIPQTHSSYTSKPHHETVYQRGVQPAIRDQYYVVDNVTVNRVDIISQMHYGTPLLWWAIVKANGSIMFDPFNIPRGTTLRIPVIDSLYKSGGALNAR